MTGFVGDDPFSTQGSLLPDFGKLIWVQNLLVTLIHS